MMIEVKTYRILMITELERNEKEKEHFMNKKWINERENG